MACDKFNSHQKSMISLKLSETEKNLIDGADECLQLLSVGTLIVRLCNK